MMPPTDGKSRRVAYSGRRDLPVVLQSHRPRRRSDSAAGEQAKGAFLLEVKGPAGGGRDAAEPAAEIRDGGPDRGLGEHPQAERQ
jgi:hypothetical protein